MTFYFLPPVTAEQPKTFLYVVLYSPSRSVLLIYSVFFVVLYL